MQSSATTPDEYIKSLPEDRQEALSALREAILRHIPPGFQEEISYGMLGFVVPHTLYPGGYHCDPRLPLPFMNIASQKNFVAVYHMGMYMDPALLQWFMTEYPKHSATKPDMGKSCIRFKKLSAIPYELIGELASKMTVHDWITLYESKLKK